MLLKMINLGVGRANSVLGRLPTHRRGQGSRTCHKWGMRTPTRNPSIVGLRLYLVVDRSCEIMTDPDERAF
jgi:hypothetical protein